MSEYWKSTPKYWCKFCQVYVRDTKLERQNHEATGRHQGNIQRSLRGLHRDHEREEREKQRAKDEVARLNGVVGGAKAPFGASSNNPWQKSMAGGASAPREATADDRKKQMQQLADMGVAIPEEYRRDMALVGDWQTVAVTKFQSQALKGEEDDMKVDVKNVGIRKRKLAGEEDEDDLETEHRKSQWGSTKRTFAGAKTEIDDFDALLGGTSTNVKAEAPSESDPTSGNNAVGIQGEPIEGEGDVANEASAESETTSKVEPTDTTSATNTQASTSNVVFKKRKKRS